MPTTVDLTEWSEERDVPLSFDQIDALRRISGSAVDIRPGDRRDRWNIKATSHVGAIRVGDLSIRIRPKIPLENVFYMLTYGQSDIDFKPAMTGYEQDELLPALAAFYERLVADTLNRGVLKSYVQHEETLVALRGRIDVPAVIRSGGIPSPIPCRFDELSIDIPENRILHSAASLLVRFPEVAPDTRRALRRSVGVLDGVVGVDKRALPRTNINRLNRHYEPALRLAELVLRSGGIRDRHGQVETSTFLIDMNQLFEDFITKQLQRRLEGRLEVRPQERIHLDVDQKISMYPDLVFYRKGKPVLVADIKYKLSDDGKARNEDYYQLLAYCTATDVPGGLLLYASDAPQVRVRSVRPRGGAEALMVYPLFLGGNMSAIHEALGYAAQWVSRSRSDRDSRVPLSESSKSGREFSVRS